MEAPQEARLRSSSSARVQFGNGRGAGIEGGHGGLGGLVDDAEEGTGEASGVAFALLAVAQGFDVRKTELRKKMVSGPTSYN